MDVGATVRPATGPNSDKSLRLSTLNSQSSSSLCHSFNVLYAICIVVLFLEMFSTPEYTGIEGKDFVSAFHASHPTSSVQYVHSRHLTSAASSESCPLQLSGGKVRIWQFLKLKLIKHQK